MSVRDDQMEDAEEAIEDMGETAESWVEQKIVNIRQSARDEPIKTLAIAAAIGAVIGVLFLR